ncbi:MAG: class I SAM-dependent methyltransferase [Candidatus Acidiferrum sp.]
MSTSDAMQRDWDERAKKNAFHYIASWQECWDIDSFLTSGERDFQQFVSPVLERCHLPPAGKVMIELGCGVGRMTRTFAHHYESVLAIDVSAEMLRQARKIHAREDNILWIHAGGTDLGFVSNGSADFVFSYLVLQHLPSEELGVGYVQEMLRVLRPGGVFLFQFNGSAKPTMNLRGRLAWGIIDSLWSLGLRIPSRMFASIFGLDPSAAGKSWRGAVMGLDKAADTVRASGGEILEISGRDTPMAWCCGIKT